MPFVLMLDIVIPANALKFFNEVYTYLGERARVTMTARENIVGNDHHCKGRR